MQTSTVIEYSPMDPYSGSYHQPPVDGHSSHGYPSVAQQPGYQQGPASFSSHTAQEHSVTERYQYNNAGSGAYQVQPSSHRYQGGGLLHTDGPRSPAYGHISGYGATASQSPVLPLPIAYIAQEQPQCKHHLSCTVVLLVLCGLHLFLPAFIFLIPALICSLMARRYRRAGEIERGRRCGIGAYCCDTMAILVYVFTLIAAFVVIALWMTGVIFCSPLPQYYSDKVCSQ